MILTGFARLGKDADLRFTQGDNATAVASLALAFNYGRKGEDNKRPTQWVDAALWGPRAESLIDYLLKGQGLDVVIEDVHIETYQRNGGGEGSKLVGRILSLEFTGAPTQQQGQQQGQQQRQPQSQGQQQQRQPQQGANGRNAYNDAKQGSGQARRAPQGGGFEEMDDDIPFDLPYRGMQWMAALGF